MLGHGIRGELDDLVALMRTVGNEAYKKVIGLCVAAAEYVAVDVSGRWPTDGDLHQVARSTVKEETRLDLSEDDVYNYLSRTALNHEPLEEALGSMEKAASLPVLITGSMLVTFRPREKEWWEYLDQIWDAIEKAENLDESVVPAVQIRAHRTQILKNRETASQQ